MSILVLVLKILAPFVAHGFATTSSARSDKRMWQAVFKTKTIIVPVVIAVGLVGDHLNQAAAASRAEGAAAEEQRTRLRLEAAAEEGQQARQRLEVAAAQARQGQQRIEETAEEVIVLMRERYPDLSELEALARVDEELRELQARSADLGDRLTGLRMYRDVAELNVFGKPGLYHGGRIVYSSPLSEALEGVWDAFEQDSGPRFEPRCDSTSRDRFSAVTESHPTFPFAHAALAACAFFNDGEGTWLRHTERAVEILRHTVQIAGHNQHHDVFYEALQSHMLAHAAQE